MFEETTIKVQDLSKIYKIFNRPKDRLKETFNFFGKKYHKQFYALNDVSFEIKKGETIGIIGRNGSGKSTLLKILTGVLTPTSGLIHVNGKVSALLELGAGFNPELTGLENVYLNGAIMGFTKEEMDKKIDNIISFAEIGDFISQPVKMYSSGMFVRLAFSVATNVNPDILIVDEALSVGDMEFQLKCIEKMKSFKKEGKTILFVSHDTYSVRNFCDNALWLMNGKIYMQGEVNQVTRQYDDYMKTGAEDKEGPQEQTETKRNILAIDKVCFLDSNKSEKSDFKFGEGITVEINYTLHSPIDGIVGGVALFDKQNRYICGLNTKLDGYLLPDKPGKYKLRLSYDDMNLLPGSYFIDIGFFESLGLVRLDYINKVASFRINSSDYVAEGMTYIKHHWNCEG